MKITTLLRHAILVLAACTAAVPAGAAEPPVPMPAQVTATMRRVADWQIGSWQKDGFKKPKTNWTYCPAYAGILELGEQTGDARYVDFVRGVGRDLEWKTGTRRYFADDYCVGQVWAELYLRDRDPAQLAQVRQLADEIAARPHDESLSLANKGIMDREWAWADAMFMGPPMLAYLSTATGNRAYLDLASRLWWKTADFLYDREDHLYFRDEKYMTLKEKNGAKVFWSRGNGWVMAGLVRVLSNMPADHPDRARFLGLYRDMAARVVALQQPDGSWHTSLLDPGSYPDKETSGTGFYTYAILWGLNNGVLDRATYWPVVARAWTVLAGAVQPDGKLGYVQPVGAAPERVDADSTETYGPGAFLLAGTQLVRYLQAWSAK
jgi:rhamnogalacturonyl hydrolase YesR